MIEQKHHHHHIDYIEFCVLDMDKTQRFYTSAFGWEFTSYGPEYAGIKVDGREVGGLRVEEPTTGGPLVVLYSDHLDHSFAAVKEAGGAICKEPFEFPGGRRFHFLDPSGNELAVWGKA